MVLIKKALILTAALASARALVIPRADHKNNEPCSVLASLDTTEIQLHHVEDCYRSIPYDRERDGGFLANLTALYDNFYVYRDLARSSPGVPFAITPVDIIKEFNEIAKREYKSAYDFHNDLRLLVSQLQDSHSVYGVACYRSFSFKQPISLYAPFVDGKQSVRVFSDTSDQDLRDCEVLSIDNEDPLLHLQAWADKHTATSKDPGVRLNAALATLTFDTETKSFTPDFGNFYSRDFLPDKPSVNYQLSCPPKKGNNRPRHVEFNAPFKVDLSLETLPYNNTASFLRFCEQPPLSIDTPLEGEGSEADLLRTRLPHVEQQRHRVRLARRDDPTAAPPTTFQHAHIVDGTKNCGFYQLKEDPSVGIVHISSMMVDAEEFSLFTHGMLKLAERNVTRIIIDLNNNGGGLVNFASDLVALFFDTPTVIQGTHQGDLRESAGVLQIGKADFANKAVETHYDVTGFMNDTTGDMITKDFYGQEGVTYTRGGATSVYSPLLRLGWQKPDFNTTFTWYNDASKVKILTNGKCGSACGMTTDHFVTKHGVEAYAIGGHHGKPLSMYSFAGASVLGWDEISRFHMKLNISAPMDVQAYAGVFNIPWYEVYSEGDTTPLDYSNERYPAKHRLDYTPDTARNQDSLWKAVAEIAWGN